MRRTITTICGLSWLLLGAGAVFAHTSVSGVEPVDGSELDEPPATIEIRFEHEVRLTSVTLLDHGTPGRRLEFSPHGSADLFRVEHPRLARGRNEIQWKALSSDGHVISGTLTYVVRSTATDAD